MIAAISISRGPLDQDTIGRNVGQIDGLSFHTAHSDYPCRDFWLIRAWVHLGGEMRAVVRLKDDSRLRLWRPRLGILRLLGVIEALPTGLSLFGRMRSTGFQRA